MKLEKFSDADLLDFYYKRRDIFPRKAKEAFLKLYEKYASMAISTAFSYTNNSDDAYSLFNDAFLMIMERKIEFDTPSHFQSYLHVAMRNRALSNERRRYRDKERLTDFYQIKNLVERPEVEKKEIDDLINELDISAVDKNIIRLKIDGYGIKEISNKLNISVNQVSVKLSRIRKKIKIE